MQLGGFVAGLYTDRPCSRRGQAFLFRPVSRQLPLMHRRRSRRRAGVISSKLHSGPKVLLDVMDTIVVDPFSVDMHQFFGFTSQADFLAAKTPFTWIEFEKGNLSEEAFLKAFFTDGTEVNGDAFREYLRKSYKYIPGMETLLQDLASVAGRDSLHVLSNYPKWFSLIEEELALSEHINWTFVSCEIGKRKPDPEMFEHVSAELATPANNLILVDDRPRNCEAALECGFLDAVHFTSADDARARLSEYFPGLE